MRSITTGPRSIHRIACLLMFVALSMTAGGFAFAERMHRDGKYAVHYNALPSTILSPDIATRYRITRSANRGFLNIAVVRGAGDGMDVAVAARITASSRSLIGQTQDIPLREIRDQDAIYYVGEFTVRGKEHLRFELSVIPEGEQKVIPVRFEHVFDSR